MKALKNPRAAAKPRWDGNCIRFEIEIDGTPIACAISLGALQEISGCRYIKSSDLLRRFADARDRIEQIAATIFAVRPDSVTGTLHIWADDIYDPPTAPATARQASLPAS
jgi:hypothetical protein